MVRKPSTDQNGNPFSNEMRQKVWQKNTSLVFAPILYDICGDLIKWEYYGDRNSNFGWEIDHINPVSNGGKDILQNLQPLHWRNNLEKSDTIYWKCPKKN